MPNFADIPTEVPSITRPKDWYIDCIQLNFATALAFGGEPAGALDAIAEAKASSDPVAVEIKTSINHWVAQMSWLRRIDWKLNHIAPKSRPTPMTALLGRFSWEVCPDD